MVEQGRRAFFFCGFFGGGAVRAGMRTLRGWEILRSGEGGRPCRVRAGFHAPPIFGVIPLRGGLVANENHICCSPWHPRVS